MPIAPSIGGGTADVWVVVTSIQEPTAALRSVADAAKGKANLVVVGDEQTPSGWADDGIDFLSLEYQLDTFGEFARAVPTRHYARKIFGYLHAIERGATVIVDTDDDTFAEDGFLADLAPGVRGRRLAAGGWANVYRYFTGAHVWPRGLPLDEIGSVPPLAATPIERDCIVQQYLIDGDTDVDAIHRLVCPNPNVTFDEADPIILEGQTIAPFNSQNTVFFEAAFPLLYLPGHCSMRMTDIWRSFVAQGALWATANAVSFHPPTTRQVRNPHSLTDDFEQEIPGYLHNRRIVQLIRDEVARREPGQPVAEVAHDLWEILIRKGHLPEAEQMLLQSWFEHFA